MTHFKVFPLFEGVDQTTRFGWSLAHGWGTLFYGLPAVIVFFVISGFCIHLPFLNVEQFSIGKYYARRYTRILVPVVGFLLVYWSVGHKLQFWGEHSVLWQSVLWSLLCEEIYYLVYPLLMRLRKRVSWKVILPSSMAVSVVLAALKPEAQSFHEFGPVQTAVILYPVWLLGCVLAEQVEGLTTAVSAIQIWGWRLLAWFGSWVVLMLHFHSRIHAMQTCLWFGALAYFWLKKEIARARTKGPPNWMAWAGAWSYSLYLMHVPGTEVFQKLPLPFLGHILDWVATMTCACLFSYVFYLVVERPSHRLARRLHPTGGTLSQKTPEIQLA